MGDGAGIYRDEAAMKTLTEQLAGIKERAMRATIDDHSLSFNTELTAALEIQFEVEISEALAHSALLRRESRGSHQRLDFPQRDDEQYLKHSLAFRGEDGMPRIEYRDVVITKWAPAARVYGTTSH
jgi:fumarate reductase flavoprotein subunit